MSNSYPTEDSAAYHTPATNWQPHPKADGTWGNYQFVDSSGMGLPLPSDAGPWEETSTLVS